MSNDSFFLRVKWFLIILLMTIIEIGPVPLLGLTFLYILAFRPHWFKDLIDRLYS